MVNGPVPARLPLASSKTSGGAEAAVFDFRAVGPGLGLGTLVQADRSKLPMTSPTHGVTSVQKSHPLPKRIPVLQSPPRSARESSLYWIGIRVQVVMIDLVMILMSLWVVFTAAVLASAIATKKGLALGLSEWLALRPVVLLTGLNPWVALAGLGLVYLVYVFMFRIIVGRTLGGSLLAREISQAPKGIAAPEVRP